MSPQNGYFSDATRWQSWLDVEAALALAQTEIGMIPADAAAIIAQNATLEAFNITHLRAEITRTMAPVFAMSECLAQACGAAGAYVHWGATTQNIIETGRLLVLKHVHAEILGKLSQVLATLARQAEAHADQVMVGRTNRQNALPITYGFKIAGWIDELTRVAAQLREAEPRLFQLRFGGAIGGYHSFGPDGPVMAEVFAKRLGLELSMVPNRTSVDPLIEYISKLSLLGVAVSRRAGELYLMMTEEIGEVYEALPNGVIGSSTMPQKINPKHVIELNTKALHPRSKAATAFATPSPSHEGDAVTNQYLTQLAAETCTLAVEVMRKLASTVAVVHPNRARMQTNFQNAREMMATEGLMMKLAEKIGRSAAHDLIHNLVAQASKTQTSLRIIMLDSPKVAEAIGVKSINYALCVNPNIGQGAVIARANAAAGRKTAQELKAAANAMLT
ncbi:MAG: hypothetical protein JKX69_05030 [Rhodobacteraceae bacterium]|nr:hypothetical protein [Paracoccaceae bacterium]